MVLGVPKTLRFENAETLRFFSATQKVAAIFTLFCEHFGDVSPTFSAAELAIFHFAI